MMNYRRYAGSLDEFYAHISDIYSSIRTKENKFPLLWYRGHEFDFFNLSPSILRGTNYTYNDHKTYSNNHLREEYRYQHFMARNYNLIECTDPSSYTVWLEIMQHHFAKTRLMDWSESAQIALLFALEAFINPQSDKELLRKRTTASPTVWVLRPAMLNLRLFQALIKNKGGDYPLIQNALSSVIQSDAELMDFQRLLGKELSKGSAKDNNIYFAMKDSHESAMNGIFCLAALEGLRTSYSDRVLNAVRNFEFNPFFYLLLRYYTDGTPVELGCLPPLAIIHPYHSQRIRAQKGAFTVFPHYIPSAEQTELKKKGINTPLMAMENMSLCQDLLYEIRITNPNRIARELISSGERRGNLYPEMQVFSQDIENGEYFV